jgi:hypothetical protein
LDIYLGERKGGCPLRGEKEGAVLQPIDGKTKLESVWDLKLNGFNRLMGPLLSRSVMKQSEELVGNIKRMIESEVKS